MRNPSQTDTMVLTIKQVLGPDGRPRDCVSSNPAQLLILTEQFNRVVLTANANNHRVITLTFDAPDSRALFQPPPPAVVNLAPNPADPQFASLQPRPVAQLVLHLRNNLGLQHRGSFDDENPAFARTLRFHKSPNRCGSGDEPDVVVESSSGN